MPASGFPQDRFQLAACGGGDVIDHCMPADVAVNSPMLIPGGSASFIIKEVIENGLGSESLKGAA
jgi:hypothetical protein